MVAQRPSPKAFWYQREPRDLTPPFQGDAMAVMGQIEGSVVKHELH